MNKDTAAGKFDQIAGKVKQGVGEAVGNQRLANKGAAEQVKGAAKETWGNVKDTAADLHDKERARASAETGSSAHNLRESATGGAQNLKNSINNKLDDLRGKQHSDAHR